MVVPLKCLPLMEECRLRVFRNWKARNTFGPKLVQEAGDWINLHNEDFSPFFFSKIIESRKMRWAGNVARMEEKISAFMVLVFKPDRQV